MKKVLIAYCTKTNTTGEIAEKISEVFTEKDISNDVKPVSAVSDPAAYDSVILGSPINGMRLLPEFTEFIRTHPELKGKTVGIYAVSIIYGNGRKMWSNAIKKDLAKAADNTDALRSTVFGGRSAEPMPGFARFLFGLPKDLPADLRDWDRIRSWAGELAESLLVA